MTTYQIDFALIKETALLGVRRAAVFLGIGLDAVRCPEVKDYRLQKFAHIELVPGDFSDEKIEEIKREFGLWIVGNGLRELVEHFGVFLEHVCMACLQCAFYKGHISREQLEKIRKNMHSRGTYDKSLLLKKEFGITAEKSQYIQSINKARACLTHRRGIVGQKDINDNNGLALRWTGIDLYLHPEGEEIIKLDLPLKEPLGPFSKPSRLKLAFVDREAYFQAGVKIEITPMMLAELCHFFILQADRFIEGAVAYAKSIGIEEM